MKTSQRRVRPSKPTGKRPASRKQKRSTIPRQPLRSYLILTAIILFWVGLAVLWQILRRMFPVVSLEAETEDGTPVPTKTPFPSLIFPDFRKKETPSVYEE
ncbi:MAG TPA: hypothetical protein PLZ55_01175 [bacterium]|nr:hypothetical protein [bacterium]HPO07250.1 hypothetical protein [bacterium]HQO35293.1 hypothetical protein [bacterium]HQP99352.1 hypothetical protein [bacterium]